MVRLERHLFLYYNGEKNSGKMAACSVQMYKKKISPNLSCCWIGICKENTLKKSPLKRRTEVYFLFNNLPLDTWEMIS